MTTTDGDKLTVYTTRPDTLFGATYMVISPEHPYLEKWADKLDQPGTLCGPIRQQAARKSDFERTELDEGKDRRTHGGRPGPSIRSTARRFPFSFPTMC